MSTASRVTVLLAALCACGGESSQRVAPRDMTPGAVAAGTRVDATIQAALSSRTSKAGDTVRAIVSRNVMDQAGGIAISAGSTVDLLVAQMESARNDGGVTAPFSIVASAVVVHDTRYPISTNGSDVPHHDEWRAGAPPRTGTSNTAFRDVIVSAGTPVTFTLKAPLNVSMR